MPTPASSSMVTGQAAAFEREKQQHQALLARLVQRAEKAEVEAGEAKGEVAALKQRNYAKGSAIASGAGALVNASKVRSTTWASLCVILACV